VALRLGRGGRLICKTSVGSKRKSIHGSGEKRRDKVNDDSVTGKDVYYHNRGEKLVRRGPEITAGARVSEAGKKAPPAYSSWREEEENHPIGTQPPTGRGNRISGVREPQTVRTLHALKRRSRSERTLDKKVE